MGSDSDSAVLGVWRSLDPPGSLLHLASVVDAESPANDHEAEVDVELLNIDATSYAELRSRFAGDAEAMASGIASIVSERGKMHNPVTGSGGVLLGRLSGHGTVFFDQLGHERAEISIGARVVPLCSLIATPLRLESVGPLDPDDPQVPVKGRCIVTGKMPCAAVPDDLPLDAVLTAFDVYPAASHVASLATPGMNVLVLGAGHAGLAAVAAGRDRAGAAGTIAVVDPSEAALGAARRVDEGVVTIRADATDALGVLSELRAAGVGRADLTVSCTNVPGCEGTAIVCTADSGTVLFFSTATSFSAAALGADSLGSLARLSIPNGYVEDKGRYLLDLLRRGPSLLQAYCRRRA